MLERFQFFALETWHKCEFWMPLVKFFSAHNSPPPHHNLRVISRARLICTSAPGSSTREDRLGWFFCFPSLAWNNNPCKPAVPPETRSQNLVLVIYIWRSTFIPSNLSQRYGNFFRYIRNHKQPQFKFIKASTAQSIILVSLIWKQIFGNNVGIVSSLLHLS